MAGLMRKALLVGAAVLVVGCQGTGSRPPADPLFVSKKPIESKAAYGPVGRSARLDLAAPPALVQTPPRDAGRQVALAAPDAPR
jgi:hypothetical protein